MDWKDFVGNDITCFLAPNNISSSNHHPSVLSHMIDISKDLNLDSLRTVLKAATWCHCQLWFEHHWIIVYIVCYVIRDKGRKEMLYLMMHSTHFVYSIMVSGIW